MARRRYHVSMNTVGIRALKNRLSAYVRLVRAGERVLVTSNSHFGSLRGKQPQS